MNCNSVLSAVAAAQYFSFGLLAHPLWSTAETVVSD